MRKYLTFALGLGAVTLLFGLISSDDTLYIVGNIWLAAAYLGSDEREDES